MCVQTRSHKIARREKNSHKFKSTSKNCTHIMLKSLIFVSVTILPVIFCRPRSDFDIFDLETNNNSKENSRSSQIRNALLANSRRGGDLEHVDHHMERMNLVVDEIECKENSRTNMVKLKDLTEQIRKSNSMSRKMGSEFRKENRSILRRLQKMIRQADLRDL